MTTSDRGGMDDGLAQQDGEIVLRDAGDLDPPDGYLTITGLMKDVIITGGTNVYHREIELVVEDASGVRQAAAVGVPSDHMGRLRRDKLVRLAVRGS